MHIALSGSSGCLSVVSSTMGVIPTIENLYQIIVIVSGTPGCRHQTATVGACCLGNEREGGLSGKWFSEKEFIFVAN